MSQNLETLRNSIKVVGEAWEKSTYYESAEEWTHLFWDPKRVFRRLFDRLDLRSVVELACGYGRHAEQCVDKCGSLTLVDIFENNLSRCRERLVQKSNVSFVLGSGYDFFGIPSDSVTAIYCYDAMVHFSPDLVHAYVKDARRILVPGGCALLHHSNYSANPDSPHYGLNPHARNHMSYSIFCDIVSESGMQITESQIIVYHYNVGGTQSHSYKKYLTEEKAIPCRVNYPSSLSDLGFLNPKMTFFPANLMSPSK